MASILKIYFQIFCGDFYKEMRLDGNIFFFKSSIDGYREKILGRYIERRP